MNAPCSLPFTDAPERIAQLIWALCQTVTERCGPRVRTLTAEQVEYIVKRLLAARSLFRRVVERIRAGNPPKARERKPRPRLATPPKPEKMSDSELNQGLKPPPGWRRWAREDRARERAARAWAARQRAADVTPLPLWRTLRQHLPGWLCGCAPAIPEFPRSAASHAIVLRNLLAEPEMRALLMSHRHVGDSLRKVCRGLGVELSLLYPEPAIPPVSAVAGTALSVRTPDEPTTAEIVSAAPPTRGASLAPHETNPPGRASEPCPRAGSGIVPSSRASPPTRADVDFFKTG